MRSSPKRPPNTARDRRRSHQRPPHPPPLTHPRANPPPWFRGRRRAHPKPRQKHRARRWCRRKTGQPKSLRRGLRQHLHRPASTPQPPGPAPPRLRHRRRGRRWARQASPSAGHRPHHPKRPPTQRKLQQQPVSQRPPSPRLRRQRCQRLQQSPHPVGRPARRRLSQLRWPARRPPLPRRKRPSLPPHPASPNRTACRATGSAWAGRPLWRAPCWPGVGARATAQRLHRSGVAARTPAYRRRRPRRHRRLAETARDRPST